MSSVQNFIQARDFLQRHREDYETAYRDFRWPVLNEFNWALDFFDLQVRDNQRPALWVVNEDGREDKLTYAQMSARSNQVANFLRGLGVKRGAWLRGYAYSFIETFVPTLTKDVVLQALA